MTNTKLLEKVIRESGVKKGYLADKIGVSRATFTALLRGESEFKASQIRVICDTLGIQDPAKMEAIFFAPSGA